MPYKIIPEKHTGRFRVINSITKEVHSYGTTKQKAEAQIRLLNAIEHGATIKEKNKSSLKNIRYH
jgi:hypothetical protein